MGDYLFKVFEACYSVQLLSLYRDLSLDVIGTGENTMVCNIKQMILFSSKFKAYIYGTRSADVVASWNCAPPPRPNPFNINNFREHLTSDIRIGVS